MFPLLDICMHTKKAIKKTTEAIASLPEVWHDIPMPASIHVGQQCKSHTYRVHTYTLALDSDILMRKLQVIELHLHQLLYLIGTEHNATSSSTTSSNSSS